MLVFGYTFAEAVQAVAGVLGMGQPVSVSKPIQDKQAVFSL